MNFKGRAKRLDDIDLPACGAEIGIGEDLVHGIFDVETAGGGFDAQGRPKMLFEPHRFWKNLGPGPKRDLAVRQGLAYQKWGTRKYPKDSYPCLIAAMKIDETAALMSASWALGQVLGENYKLAGFASVQRMVAAMLDDEEDHLRAMINFIKNAGLGDELRVLQAKLDKGQDITPDDARPFVSGYNGPAYAKHNYHGKFAKAVNKWRRIPDTPFTMDRRPVNPNPLRQWQVDLNELIARIRAWLTAWVRSLT